MLRQYRLLICIIISALFLSPAFVFASSDVDKEEKPKNKATNLFEETQRTKLINLVYDDSGSMICQNSQYVDRWGQAKYAMEVVASMLNTEDMLNIYVMSDYVNGADAPPRITLSGDSSPQSNADKIHNMLTNASGTPFASVRKAYADIVAQNADEKWLVVLTDGLLIMKRANALFLVFVLTVSLTACSDALRASRGAV
jgi:hypothetical protein